MHLAVGTGSEVAHQGIDLAGRIGWFGLVMLDERQGAWHVLPLLLLVVRLDLLAVLEAAVCWCSVLLVCVVLLLAAIVTLLALLLLRLVALLLVAALVVALRLAIALTLLRVLLVALAALVVLIVRAGHCDD